MELQAFLDGTDDCEDVIRRLQGEPYHLEVRHSDDLYSLMFSDASPSTEDHPIMRHIVGTVVDKSTNRIVGYGFPRTDEIIVDPSTAKKIIEASLENENLEDCQVIRYVEGVKLTVYHAAEKWRISTNKSIDAHNAYWRNPISFGKQFLDALALVNHGAAEQLITNSKEGPFHRGISYTFILTKPAHLQSHYTDVSDLILAASVTVPSVSSVPPDVDDIGVPRPEKLKIKSVEDILRLLDFQTCCVPGLIFHSNQSERRLKFLTDTYVSFKDIGGNHSNVKFQYLTIRGEEAKRQMFLQFYPQFVNTSLGVDASLYLIARKLFDMYVRYWIHKYPRPQFAHPVFAQLKCIHSEHLNTRVKTTFQVVYNHLVSQSPDRLWRLIELPPRYFDL